VNQTNTGQVQFKGVEFSQMYNWMIL